MAEKYSIEAADSSTPITPKLLRELRDLLLEDEDLDLGVRLMDQPPAPGEQGAIPIAVEILATVTPLGKYFAAVLSKWIDARKVSIKMTREKDKLSYQINAGNLHDAERLIADLANEDEAKPHSGD